MGKKRAFPWRYRVAAIVLLLLIAVAAFAWWKWEHWTPDRDAYPVQGVLIGARDGAPNFEALAAIGADFVYLEASKGEKGRDPSFARNLEAIRQSKLPFGAVHAYDPCIPAEKQAANFVTIVPRDPGLLPPVISLDTLAVDCPTKVSDPAVESELTTFLNQIEGHVGKPALLMISPRFEERYHIASRIDRNLWLERNFFEPEYGGRPWALWTANSELRNAASAMPVRWVVALP